MQMVKNAEHDKHMNMHVPMFAVFRTTSFTPAFSHENGGENTQAPSAWACVTVSCKVQMSSDIESCILSGVKAPLPQ
jgi:hypothetical protein